MNEKAIVRSCKTCAEHTLCEAEAEKMSWGFTPARIVCDAWYRWHKEDR